MFQFDLASSISVNGFGAPAVRLRRPSVYRVSTPRLTCEDNAATYSVTSNDLSDTMVTLNKVFGSGDNAQVNRTRNSIA